MKYRTERKENFFDMILMRIGATMTPFVKQLAHK